MNVERMLQSMQRTPNVIAALVQGMGDASWRWKPTSGNWSILEIVCHLGDEEVDDFRTRVRLTLEDASQDWPAIDPQGWAEARRYNDCDPAEALARFTEERQRSLAWLRALHAAPWDAVHHHPKMGSLRAGDVFAAWVAHDALHLRQIIKRLYELTQRDAGQFRTEYAGQWTQ